MNFGVTLTQMKKIVSTIVNDILSNNYVFHDPLVRVSSTLGYSRCLVNIREPLEAANTRITRQRNSNNAYQQSAKNE